MAAPKADDALGILLWRLGDDAIAAVILLPGNFRRVVCAKPDSYRKASASIYQRLTGSLADKLVRRHWPES